MDEYGQLLIELQEAEADLKAAYQDKVYAQDLIQEARVKVLQLRKHLEDCGTLAPRIPFDYNEYGD